MTHDPTATSADSENQPPKPRVWTRSHNWLKSNEAYLTAIALLVSALALFVSGLQTCELKTQIQQESAADFHERTSRYIEQLYTRKESCAPSDGRCDLHEECMAGCEKQCPFAHDTRIRMEAARSLLLTALNARPELRHFVVYPYGETNRPALTLSHAALPWLVIPAGHYSDIVFQGADLRCADFRHASFDYLDFQDADLRGAWLHEEKLKGKTRWKNALCPNGERAAPPTNSPNGDDTCVGRMKRDEARKDPHLCDVNTRPAACPTTTPSATPSNPPPDATPSNPPPDATPTSPPPDAIN